MQGLLFVDLWPEDEGAGRWKPRFAEIPRIAATLGIAIRVEHFTRIDPTSLADDRPQGIILSGSRSNLLEDPAGDPEDGVSLPEFAGLTATLARVPEVPVLGICFGFQYLMFAAGGTLSPLPEMRRESAWPIELIEPDPLFAGLPAPRCVENHLWRVAQPAPGYRVIARSSDGIEAARHQELPRAGVQFHPEYHDRPGATSDGERILINWMSPLAPRR